MAEEIITLITGGNRGMGFEIAKELGAKGQHVIIGSRNLDKGQKAVAKLAQDGVSAEALELDVTDHDSVLAAAKTLKKAHGRLDILINNAGATFGRLTKPSKISQDDLQKNLAVNYFGLIDVTQAMLPLLKKSSSAKIINISSMMGSMTAALTPGSEVFKTNMVGYQASKSAANMFTIQLAKELKDYKPAITVNAVDPGMVATQFGGVPAFVSKQMGGKPVDQGVARTVELALDPANTTTATFSNTNGIVHW
ncbi:SDR family oxidoreductase [Lacticaseibacillus pabuli]|uniref:SDR family oxidoreductase n=1 Tax=Lacticaseibacillus pabuli TaxID=3025672 RepID=A0ABY7WS48_9LACO|nr:SDR family oxidoreductase [Lacticaseibacillus sp. KACC 23028]WDF83010.1 SDR family oxidoreductase [Lacticaseibacillus sp. KACC 23028]